MPEEILLVYMCTSAYTAVQLYEMIFGLSVIRVIPMVIPVGVFCWCVLSISET